MAQGRRRGTGRADGAPGSQTLARGLAALQLVADIPERSDRPAGRRRHRRAPNDRLSPAHHACAVPVRGQGRRRPIPLGRRARGARRVVRQQRPAAEPAHPARAGRRTRHHGVAARRRGRPAGGHRGDRADATSSTNCRSTRAAATRWSAGAAGHRPAGEHAAAARRTRPGSADPQTGLGHHARRDRAEHLRPGRAGPPAVRRRRRHASTSSPTARTW